MNTLSQPKTNASGAAWEIIEMPEYLQIIQHHKAIKQEVYYKQKVLPKQSPVQKKCLNHIQ